MLPPNCALQANQLVNWCAGKIGDYVAIMKLTNILGVIVLVSALGDAKYNGPTNSAGLKLIKVSEGYRGNFYLDARGIRTIGYGHACHVYSCSVPLRGKYKVPLSGAAAESLLKEDLKSYENCVKGAVKYSKLNANQFSALTSFTFNLGCGSLKSSTLLKKLNTGDVTGASKEFEKWVYAGKVKLAGLVTRRAAERKLFCTGSACGGGGWESKSCTGNTTAGLNIRSSASTSGKVSGSLSNGASFTITGRVTGTNVNGNKNWFKVSKGYVSAYYVNIASSNGKSWCKK